MIKYTFSLNDGTNERAVAPIWKDDTAVEYQQESGEMFYRATLSGRLTFLRGDYDHIMGKPFDYVHILKIYKQNDYNTPTTLYHTCKFMRTDCEIDVDNRTIVVQPTIVDQYAAVLAGMEKEYNLAQLAIATQQIDIDKRPMVQLYVPSDNVVSCFLSGMAWEQDVISEPSEKNLRNVYHFSLSNILKEINITNAGDANALYVGRMQEGSTPDQFSGIMRSSENPNYHIFIQQTWHEEQAEPYPVIYWDVLVEIRNTQDEAIYRYESSTTDPEPFDTKDYDIPKVSGGEAAHAEQKSYNVYARCVTDAMEINGQATSALPTDDIVPNNRNYRRCVGYKLEVSYISDRESEEPTEYGRTDNGTYFLPPLTTQAGKFYPIARSTWRYASLWYKNDDFDAVLLEQSGRKTYTLRDAYSIGAVIKALLAQFAPEITHEETPEYSQFLYGATNPITHTFMRVLCTQKSNLLIGEYQDPAQNVPATLQMFTAMLKNTFRCYWYIEDNKFKVEHISFFENGGQYTGTPTIGIDLTALYNIRNGKPWNYAEGAYKFEKEQMPERYQFDWMDEVTLPFKGNAIDIVSNYVQEGKIEDINISNFTSDLDYILLNANDISKDGFVLFGAIGAEGFQHPQDPEGFGNISAVGTIGYASPQFDTKELTAGKAVLKYQATGYATRVVYYSENSILSLGEQLIVDGSIHETELQIPAGTRKIGFLSTDNRRLQPTSRRTR